MPAERYFIPCDLLENQTVRIEGQEYHHLRHVMRTEVGDSIELVNGKSFLAEGRVQSIGKNHGEILVLNVKQDTSSKPLLILAQAIPRMNRLEYILEKGTELGVREFWLFPSQLSEKSTFSPNQQNRLQQMTVSAMKQCGRLDLPPIKYLPPLKEWPQESILTSFFGDTREKTPYLTKNEQIEPFLLFIGPESGFHPSEVSLLETKFHAKGIKLHENILRVDTAAIIGIHTFHTKI